MNPHFELLMGLVPVHTRGLYSLYLGGSNGNHRAVVTHAIRRVIPAMIGVTIGSLIALRITWTPIIVISATSMYLGGYNGNAN